MNRTLKMCAKRVISSFLLMPFLSGIHCFLLDELVTEIFRDYEPAVRPRCDAAGSTNVTMGLALRQIVDLNEPLQILSTIVWVRLSWWDCRLKWNASQFQGLDEVVVPQARVWAPDMTLYDNADKNMFGMEEFNMVVSSEGVVKFNFPAFVKSLCAVDSTYFPFDSQACKLTFGSWTYNGASVNISAASGSADLAAYVPNTEWSIQSVPGIRRETFYGDDFYPTVTYVLRLERRPLFYILNLLFPCGLISSVAILGFMLPPASGEKMNLEITVMLSLSVFQLIVLEMMPPAGDRIPFIAMYFTISLILVGLSCLATVAVLSIHFKGFGDTRVPPWVKRYIFQPLARVTRTKVGDPRTCGTFMEPRMDRKRRGSSIACGNYLRRMSTCSVRSDNSQRTRSRNGYKSESYNLEPVQNGVDGDSRAPANVTSESQDMYKTAYTSGQNQTDILYLIERVNNLLESLNETMLMQDTPNCNAPDGVTWPMLALILDRLFMGVYILCLVIGATALAIKYVVLAETPELSV